MGKIHKIKKDKKIRKFFYLNELKTIRMKYIINNFNINVNMKNFIYMKYILKFHLNYSFCRIVNRCVISGHASWILNRFKMTRMTFKNLADYGKLNGVMSSSW